jgi:hypothetical protein
VEVAAFEHRPGDGDRGEPGAAEQRQESGPDQPPGRRTTRSPLRRGNDPEACEQAERTGDERAEVKGTNNPIGPLTWKFAADSDMIRCALLAPLPRPVSHVRFRCVVSTDRVRAGHRDHGAPTPGPCSPTAASRACQVSASGSSNPRRTQSVAPPSPMALFHGHPRDLVAVASRGSQAQVATLEKATRPWSPADER